MLDQAAVFDDLKEVVRHGGNSVFLAVTIDAVVDFNAHGVAFFTMVGQIRTFDEQEAVINGIAEENTGKGLGNNAADLEGAQAFRRLFTRRAAAEVIAGYDDVARPDRCCQLRPEGFENVGFQLFHCIQW